MGERRLARTQWNTPREKPPSSLLFDRDIAASLIVAVVVWVPDVCKFAVSFRTLAAPFASSYAVLPRALSTGQSRIPERPVSFVERRVRTPVTALYATTPEEGKLAIYGVRLTRN